MWAGGIYVIPLFLCCRCRAASITVRFGWLSRRGSFHENSLRDYFWTDWLTFIALKICPRHLCQVEKLIDLILIGGAFNVLSFSIWLEFGVSMHLVHGCFIANRYVVEIRALLAWCVYQLHFPPSCVVLLIPDTLVVQGPVYDENPNNIRYRACRQTRY